MSTVELSAHQLEQLAELVADRLADRAAGELIDASELARRIGRSREFVYDHSDSFGGIRLGGGERPRVWFRWPHALDKLAELEESPKRRSPRISTSNRPRRRRPRTSTTELLPIRGGKVPRSAA